MQSFWTQDKYIETYFYAAKVHNNQKFPGTNLPYIVHISLVSMEVMAVLKAGPGLDGDLALQCALLHDVIEDCGITFDKLSASFATELAHGVQALSKNQDLPKEQQMPECLDRIKMQPPEIWIVKMADRITNLLPPPGHWGPSKIQDYLNESVKIHEALKSASAILADRLSAKIESYEKFLDQRLREPPLSREAGNHSSSFS